MRTILQPVDPQAPATEIIGQAAEVLRRGGLVAFPTETVYGLGGNALDASAVRRIFEAKGRPDYNPIIVHVAEARQAETLVTAWPTSAQRLAERFWPGPLTLVLPKSAAVPDEVTAGGPTVAVRMPAHPVALALIRATGVSVAAPSANRSGFLSPTRAEHVLRGLEGRIDLILDGGPTPGGVESTVLDLTRLPAVLLRPGLIALADLEAVIGPIQTTALAATTPLPSPGMLPRHYAPATRLECSADDAVRVAELCRQGLRIGWVTFADRERLTGPIRIDMPADALGYAVQLYDALHRLDQAGLDRIVVARPPDAPEWLAIHDRLQRAAAQ